MTHPGSGIGQRKTTKKKQLSTVIMMPLEIVIQLSDKTLKDRKQWVWYQYLMREYVYTF